MLQGPTAPPSERTWLWQFLRWRQNQRWNPPSLGPPTFRLGLLDHLEDKLPRVTAPSLVVRGQFDPICRQTWAEQVARRLPDGRLVLIPSVAHTLVFTAPEPLAAVARGFLQE